MATTTYTVKKGDTLSEIAYEYYKKYGYSSWKTYMNYLAEINNISNVNLIHVGQKLTLWGTASSSPTSSTATKVKIQHFGLQANTDNTLFVMWTFSRANTDKYQVKWEYRVGSLWFVGSDSTTTEKQHIYNYPSNAEKVKVRIKPIAKTYQKNNKTYSYYTGSWSDRKEYDVGASVPLPTPNVPTVSIEEYYQHTNPKSNSDKTVISLTTTITAYKLIAKITDYSFGAAKPAKGEERRIHFELYKTDSSGVKKKVGSEYSDISATSSFGVKAGTASVTFYELDENADYQVWCRAVFFKSGSGVTRQSEWTKLSDSVRTASATPKSLVCTDIKSTAENEFDVFLEWSGLNDVKYEVEYTTNPDYFDSGASTQKQTAELPSCVIVGLDGGNTYFFRVRSKNEAGESGWSAPIYVTLGEEPTAPTTWSMTNSVVLGEDSTLYWMHNSIDGTDQKYAEIELTIDGVKREKNIIITHLKENQLVESYQKGGALRDEIELIMIDSKEPINYYVLKTVENDQEIYPDGASINWRVRTAGLLSGKDENDNEVPIYGDYSMTRTIEVRVQPKLVVNVSTADSTDVEEINAFPLFISANVTEGTNNQTPIMYHLSIYANDAYETVDGAGNSKTIREGESIYSNHFDPTGPEFYETDDDGHAMWKPYEFKAMVSASDIDLENGISYTVTCMVTMNSGLTGTGSTDILVAWDDLYYEPDAEVVVDDDIYAAHIRPYCGRKPYYKVQKNDEVSYVKTDELIAPCDGEAVTVDLIVSIQHTSLSDDIIEVVDDSATYTITKSGPVGVYLDVFSTSNADKLLLIKMSGYISFEISNRPEGFEGIYVDDVFYSQTGYSGLADKGVYLKTPGSYHITQIANLTINAEVMHTTTGEIVYETEDGSYFCIGDDLILDEDVLLSVYRRDFDGTFTELAVDLDNTGTSYITDPHPALNYARYRVIAKSKTTGSISYTDISDVPIGGNAIVIQWDEDWGEYQMDNYNESETPAWSGSMLILPYNIDVSDSYNMDVSLVNYIGRKRPVSYYGTHLDEKSSWSTEIPSYDHVTLAALRRLAIYTGDVYVREPSGSGYWANIKVSFSQTHCEVTIPITFEITRVEGGI